MANLSPEQITGLLVRWSEGDEEALDTLLPLVYPDLRRLASYLLKGDRPGHTLQPTALVNEAYLKLHGAAKIPWQNRTHFIAVAARAMRQVLCDYARKRNRDKHGGGMAFVPLDEVFDFAPQRSAGLIALDDALIALAGDYPVQAKVVELRFFGGLTNGEISALLNISVNTAIRYWTFAQSWIGKHMEGIAENGTDKSAED
jgi:RNA polymerase sigma factor (TIGR02999 family)